MLLSFTLVDLDPQPLLNEMDKGAGEGISAGNSAA